MDPLQQDGTRPGGRGDQAVHDDPWHCGAHACGAADALQYVGRVVDDGVACARVPIASPVHDHVTTGGFSCLAQHTLVAVVADADAHEHQTVCEADGGRHDDRARSVPPQVAPGNPPQHHVLPAIVGAGSMRAAFHAGHKPHRSATTIMTRMGCTIMKGSRTKYSRSEKATPM